MEQSKTLFSNEKVLKQLGAIVTFDLLLNNWDRYPCVWKNEGNPKNIMFSVENIEAIGIDNSCYSIDKKIAKENYESYLASVEGFLKEMSADGNRVYTSKVRNFICNMTNFDIEEKGTSLFIQGAKETALRIAQLSEKDLLSIKSEVEQLLEPTLSAIGLDWKMVGFHRIDTLFIMDIVSLFKKTLN